MYLEKLRNKPSLKHLIILEKIDQDLVNSQEARRILDRIIGFKLSKLLQSKIKSKSAGRVQSVALKLIVDLEKEIEALFLKHIMKLKLIFLILKRLTTSLVKDV